MVQVSNAVAIFIWIDFQSMVSKHSFQSDETLTNARHFYVFLCFLAIRIMKYVKSNSLHVIDINVAHNCVYTFLFEDRSARCINAPALESVDWTVLKFQIIHCHRIQSRI